MPASGAKKRRKTRDEGSMDQAGKDKGTRGGRQVSAMNILKLFSYAALIVIGSLIVLVIVFHIIIMMRQAQFVKQMANVRKIGNLVVREAADARARDVQGIPAKPQFLIEEEKARLAGLPVRPRRLNDYEGPYVLVEGPCGKEFRFEINNRKDVGGSGFNPDYLNQGLTITGGYWFTSVYVKDSFDGWRLRHMEKRGMFAFLASATEDWAIDFSRFPEIVVRDYLKKTTCRYRHGYTTLENPVDRRQLTQLLLPETVPDPKSARLSYWEGSDATPFTQHVLRDQCWPPDQKVGPYDFMMRLCDYVGSENYEELLERDPRDGIAYFFRALVEIQAGKLEEAMADVKRAKEFSPNKDSWKFKFLEEYFYHELGQYEKAAEAYSSMTRDRSSWTTSVVGWQASLLNIDSRLRTFYPNRFDTSYFVDMDEIKKQIDSMEKIREKLCSDGYDWYIRGKLDGAAFADAIVKLKERADKLEGSFFNIEFFDRLVQRKEWWQVFELGDRWVKRFPERPEGYYHRALGFLSGASRYQALDAWDDMNEAIELLHQQAPCSYFMCRSRIGLVLSQKDATERIRPGGRADLTPQYLIRTAMADLQRGLECPLKNREAVEVTMRLAGVALALHDGFTAQTAISLARRYLEQAKADPSLGGDMDVPAFELAIKAFEEDLSKFADQEAKQ